MDKFNKILALKRELNFIKDEKIKNDLNNNIKGINFQEVVPKIFNENMVLFQLNLVFDQNLFDPLNTIHHSYQFVFKVFI